MIPDDLCEANAGKIKITVQIDDDEGIVLIEGEAQALEFVGKLIIAQAEFEKDCSFFLHPHGPGNVFFTGQSTHGLYIHRLPCMEPRF